jgi:hypothetical protein
VPSTNYIIGVQEGHQNNDVTPFPSNVIPMQLHPNPGEHVLLQAQYMVRMPTYRLRIPEDTKSSLSSIIYDPTPRGVH